MRLFKFFLALLAGLGLVKILRFVAEAEVIDDEEFEIYDNEPEYPLFV